MANGNGFFICKGKRFSHKRDSMGSLINSDIVDAFTPLHAGMGYLFGRFGWHPVVILAIGVTWDWGIERAMKCRWPEMFPNPSQDTYKHVVADLTAYLGGAYFGRRGYLAKQQIAVTPEKQNQWTDIYRRARDAGYAPFDAEKMANEMFGKVVT